ncbi:MAG: hypothetical protein ACE5EY_13400, partial [Anaerolineae bacterium]
MKWKKVLIIIMSIGDSKLFKWFWRIAGAVSVRTKILGIVLWLVLLLGVGIALQVRVVMHNALADRMQAQGVSIARDLAARTTDLILINDLYALHQLLAETQANNAVVCQNYSVPVDPSTAAATELIDDVLVSAIIPKVNQGIDVRGFEWSAEFRRLGFNSVVQIADTAGTLLVDIDSDITDDTQNALLGETGP